MFTPCRTVRPVLYYPHHLICIMRVVYELKLHKAHIIRFMHNKYALKMNLLQL